MGRRRIDGWITPLWLSHHDPDDYDRCVRIGRSHVCRRCLWLYPISVAVLIAGLAVADVPAAVTAVALIVLPLPAVVEWVLEHRGRVAYSPRRQVLVTIPLAIGLGAGFVRYFASRTDPLFWGIVVLYAGACAAVALLWRAPPPDDR